MERCLLRELDQVPEDRRAWKSPVAVAAVDAVVAADAAAEAAAAAVVAAAEAVAAAAAAAAVGAEVVAGSGAWGHPGPGRDPWALGSD